MTVMVMPWACAGEKKGIERTVKQMPPKIKRMADVIDDIGCIAVSLFYNRLSVVLRLLLLRCNASIIALWIILCVGVNKREQPGCIGQICANGRPVVHVE